MTYDMKALPCDPTALPGLSPASLNSHTDGNGYGRVAAVGSRVIDASNRARSE